MLKFKSSCHFKIILLRASIVEGICYHQHWRCAPTAAIPRPKATSGPNTYWSQLLLIRMSTLSFLCLEGRGCTALVGTDKEGDPFSGWATVQAGMKRLWGQESQHQRVQAGSTGLLGEAGLGLFYLITSSPQKMSTRLFLFLVNIYTKNQLFYDSVIKHFLG